MTNAVHTVHALVSPNEVYIDDDGESVDAPPVAYEVHDPTGRIVAVYYVELLGRIQAEESASWEAERLNLNRRIRLLGGQETRKTRVGSHAPRTKSTESHLTWADLKRCHSHQDLYDAAVAAHPLAAAVLHRIDGDLKVYAGDRENLRDVLKADPSHAIANAIAVGHACERLDTTG